MLFQAHVFVCERKRDKKAGRPSCGRSVDVEAIVSAGKNSIKKNGLSAQIRVQKSGCLEHCEAGPATIIYPEGIALNIKSPKQMKSLVESIACAISDNCSVADAIANCKIPEADLSKLPLYKAQVQQS